MELSKDTVELLTNPFKEREYIISNSLLCIGPPDLVFSPKISSEKSKSKINFFLCGFQSAKSESIHELFDVVLQMKPKGLFKKFKFKLSEMSFSTWNSFENYDVTFNVKPNEKNIEYEISGKNNDQVDQAKMFKEIKLSQALRYWILPKYIFDLRCIEKEEMKIFKPCNFTDDEILYIAENHPYCHEVEMALANYLISLGDFSKLKEIFLMIVKRMPRIICYIYNILSKYPTFEKDLSNLLIESYKYFSDDILIAYDYIKLSPEVSNYEKVIPLLINGCLFSPVACACMSHLIMKSENPEDAIFCLNSAFYTKINKKNKYVKNHDFKNSKIKKTEQKLYLFEKDLIDFHFYDHKYYIYKELNELSKTVSQIRIRTILNSKFSSKQDTSYSNFDFQDNFDSKNDFLYDPGISTTAIMPPFLKELPLSSEFYNIANDFFDDIQFKDKIIRVKKLENEAEALKALIISIKLNNPELYKISIDELRSKKKLLPIYLTFGFQFNLIDSTSFTSKTKISNYEKSYLAVFQEIYEGISKII